MIIDFDETNFEDISKVITKLNTQRNKLMREDPVLRMSNARYQNRMAGMRRDFEAILKLYESDVDGVYDDTSPDTDFYVYVHCNPLQIINAKYSAKHLFCATELDLRYAPFYVGKGRGDRCYDLNRNEGHRKIKQFINKANHDVVVVNVREGLSEQSALALESKLIDILGLRQLHEGNLLVNLDEGHHPEDRRDRYIGKDVTWYLNRTKMQVYNSVPKG